MKSDVISRGRPDFLLLFLTILLVGFGLVMIFSSSSPISTHKFQNPWHFIHRQSLFAVAGLFIMLLFMNIRYTIWKSLSFILLFISLASLVFVLQFGINTDGVTRWFVIAGFNIQPAEFAKLAVIIYLSALISKKGEGLRHFKTGLLPILLVVGSMILLVMKQPDFGTALLLLIIAGAIVIIGGANLRQIFAVILCMLPILFYLVAYKSYRLERITSFLNPWDSPDDSGYQLIQSKFALAHGGVMGVGLGNSIQKLLYLPEGHTDFIFSIIGEELGLVGSMCFFLVFFLFIFRGFLTAIQCSDSFGQLLGMGIVIMIFVQFIFNLGAVTGSLPITGVPLPFISYGGSSLILCLASTGILLSISRENSKLRGNKNK